MTDNPRLVHRIWKDSRIVHKLHLHRIAQVLHIASRVQVQLHLSRPAYPLLTSQEWYPHQLDRHLRFQQTCSRRVGPKV